MKSKYHIVKALLNYLEEFENNSDDSNLYDFTEWLLYRLGKKTKYVSSKKLRVNEFKEPEYLTYMKSLNSRDQLLEYIIRIARYQDFYSRRFLEDLPVNSRLEFSFLHTIDTFQYIKKTDLINIHLVEYSTGMDIIKRLMNQGLIRELQNSSDKRTKLLEITGKGKNLLKIASKRMKDKASMFLACINENKWRKILPILEEICSFHSDIYSKYNDKPYPELMNLVDSLKHYYK